MSWMPDEQLIPTFIVDLPLAREALARARELHRGQHRESDRAPFILHPLEVAALLHNTGHPEHVVAVNTDPCHAQETMVQVPIHELGIDEEQPYVVQDLLTGTRYTWRGVRNYVRLDPADQAGHVLRVEGAAGD